MADRDMEGRQGHEAEDARADLKQLLVELERRQNELGEAERRWMDADVDALNQRWEEVAEARRERDLSLAELQRRSPDTFAELHPAFAASDRAFVEAKRAREELAAAETNAQSAFAASTRFTEALVATYGEAWPTRARDLQHEGANAYAFTYTKDYGERTVNARLITPEVALVRESSDGTEVRIFLLEVSAEKPLAIWRFRPRSDGVDASVDVETKDSLKTVRVVLDGVPPQIRSFQYASELLEHLEDVDADAHSATVVYEPASGRHTVVEVLGKSQHRYALDEAIRDIRDRYADYGRSQGQYGEPIRDPKRFDWLTSPLDWDSLDEIRMLALEKAESIWEEVADVHAEIYGAARDVMEARRDEVAAVYGAELATQLDPVIFGDERSVRSLLPRGASFKQMKKIAAQPPVVLRTVMLRFSAALGERAGYREGFADWEKYRGRLMEGVRPSLERAVAAWKSDYRKVVSASADRLSEEDVSPSAVAAFRSLARARVDRDVDVRAVATDCARQLLRAKPEHRAVLLEELKKFAFFVERDRLSMFLGGVLGRGVGPLAASLQAQLQSAPRP
jgi:hypothetical protein